MVVGSRPDGGGDAPAISSRVRSTVKSIKEVVGDHSESDIYAVLTETNMDPNEAAQKLLNQDPFHEVRRRRDRKKENGSYNNGTDDPRVQKEIRTEWKRPDRSWDRINNRAGRGGYTKTGRGGYSRPTLPGPVKEFRVVRDNRTKKKGDEEVVPPVVHSFDVCNIEGAPDSVDKSSKEESTTQKLSPPPLTISAAQPNSNHVTSLPRKESRVEICSSSDPIHVNVGLTRREVGVVGLRKPPSASVYDSRNLISVSNNGNNNKGFTSENQRHHARPNSRGNRIPPQSSLASESGTKSVHLSQYNGKVFQQSVSHQKAQQPNMEWRPKSSQSPRVNNSLTNQNLPEAAILSENLAKSNISEDRHVIIPEHLRVPDSEKTSLIFGSFDTVKSSKETSNQPSLSDALEPPSELEQTEINEAQLQADSNLQLLSDEGPQNIPDPATTESVSEYESTLPHDLQENPSDIQSFKEYDPHSRYDIQFLNPVGADSVVGTEDASAIATEEMSSIPTNTNQFLTYPVTLQQQQQQQQQQNAVQYQQQQQQQVPQMYQQVQLSPFSNYVPYRHVYPPVYVPPQMAVQNYPNTPQYPHPTHGNSYLLMPTSGPTQQVQLSRFSNYVPYRHVYPPVYVPPQMAVQNYRNTPQYPHPTHGNSYLLMPTSGPTQVTVGGLKYGANQYKPVFTGNGYGNYTNPSNGYPVTPGVIGPTFDDSNRVKFKENNLYVPNQQVEASDIWVQNPRELLNMPSAAPFYNVPTAQPSNPHHAAAYLQPTHNGSASFNASFNAAPPPQPPPHVQYPPPLHHHHTGHQPASMALMPPGPPLNMVHHQQVPPSNMGVGVVGPAGAFQQNHQLGPIGWTPNF